MRDNAPWPTPYPEINSLVNTLLANVQTTLKQQVVGMYLEGSLTSAAFDAASDIDFVVVTDEEVTNEQFAALQAMHDRIAAIDSPWAIQLEGSYISRSALRRFDPAHALHPNIERGPTERLKKVQHDAAWIIHRAILRQRGITLVGSPPETLIDPISPTDLRRAMGSMLLPWATSLLHDSSPLQARGFQSYVVLTLCRVHYTLHQGAVASKPEAARWALATLDQRWAPLIERALVDRHNGAAAMSAPEVRETLEFMRYTLACSEQWEHQVEWSSSRYH